MECFAPLKNKKGSSLYNMLPHVFRKMQKQKTYSRLHVYTLKHVESHKTNNPSLPPERGNQVAANKSGGELSTHNLFYLLDF